MAWLIHWRGRRKGLPSWILTELPTFEKILTLLWSTLVLYKCHFLHRSGCIFFLGENAVIIPVWPKEKDTFNRQYTYHPVYIIDAENMNHCTQPLRN